MNYIIRHEGAQGWIKYACCGGDIYCLHTFIWGLTLIKGEARIYQDVNAAYRVRAQIFDKDKVWCQVEEWNPEITFTFLPQAEGQALDTLARALGLERLPRRGDCKDETNAELRARCREVMKGY